MNPACHPRKVGATPTDPAAFRAQINDRAWNNAGEEEEELDAGAGDEPWTLGLGCALIGAATVGTAWMLTLLFSRWA